MKLKDDKETYHAKNAQEWRNWLMKNHQTKKSVWLIIYHKGSGNKSIYCEDAVEQAICFGWVDSKPNKRDDKSYYLYFASRNKNSNWSKANRARALKMIEKGQMMPSGQKSIDIAKESRAWTALVDVQNGVIPDDLQKLFDRNQKAFEHFQKLSSIMHLSM